MKRDSEIVYASRFTFQGSRPVLALLFFVRCSLFVRQFSVLGSWAGSSSRIDLARASWHAAVALIVLPVAAGDQRRRHDWRTTNPRRRRRRCPTAPDWNDWKRHGRFFVGWGRTNRAVVAQLAGLDQRVDHIVGYIAIVAHLLLQDARH